MKEINYPEHLHLKNGIQEKLQKKDLMYIKKNLLHPSTAPNKYGKTKQLFQSKKAMEMKSRKEEAHKKAKNVFKEESQDRHTEVDERKVLTKSEYQRLATNKQQNIQRRLRKATTLKNESKNFKRKITEAGFDNLNYNRSHTTQNNLKGKDKTKKDKKRFKPKLLIDTELEESKTRKVATTKNFKGYNGLSGSAVGFGLDQNGKGSYFTAQTGTKCNSRFIVYHHT